MHTLVMIMKIHSYLSVNGAMMNAYQDLEQLERTLGAKLATYYDANTLDAWDRAVAHTSIAPSPDEPHAAQGAFREWAAHAIQAGSSATRASFRLPQLATPVPHAPDVATIPGHTTDPRAVRDPHPLAWHPDREVRALAVQIERMRARLYAEAGQGQEPRAMWPYSVSVADFTYFQLVPTLVYQLAYPSTERVRPLYVLERILATFGTFLVIYVITVNWIIPVRLEPDSNLFVVFVRLSVPMILCVRRMADQYLFIFYLIFECVCNGFAELTRFADREFYQDWWNSTSMAEFSRKWNTVRRVTDPARAPFPAPARLRIPDL